MLVLEIIIDENANLKYESSDDELSDTESSDDYNSLEEDEELMLQQEVDILSQLDHPNVVKLFEIFDEGACLYLVMELMSGGEVSTDV